MTPMEFHGALMAFVDPLGESVTSYKRSPKRNLAVGGVVNSKHQIWMGADVGAQGNRQLLVE